jgi:hypothetical protein
MSRKIFNHIYPSKREVQQTSLLSESARGNYYTIALRRRARHHPLSGNHHLLYLQNNETKKSKPRTHRKLSSQNKQIIDTMAETEKTTKPTLQAIANTYKSKTNLQTEDKDLLQKLSKTEKTDIIKGATANILDQPAHTWKTRMTTTKSKEHKRLSMWKQIITRGSK